MKGFEFLIFAVVVLAVVIAFAGFCFDYSLYSYFGKDIPWYGDCIAGVFTSPINIPATVVAFILRSCDVEVPIIPGMET